MIYPLLYPIIQLIQDSKSFCFGCNCQFFKSLTKWVIVCGILKAGLILFILYILSFNFYSFIFEC
jgi:hypothetical protein